MPSLTRRRALQAAVGVLSGLAGCNDATTGPDPDDAPTGTPAVDREPSGPDYARDPESVVLRTDGVDPQNLPAWYAHEPEAVPTDGGTVASSDRAADGLIADRETAETFTTADGRSVSDVSDSPERVREFVLATDFEAETVFVDHWFVEECYRVQLCYVDWSDGELESKFGTVLRDHDVHCDAHDRDTAVTVARLPVALDPDEIRTGSTSYGTNGCDRRVDGGRGSSDESDELIATTSGGSESGSQTVDDGETRSPTPTPSTRVGGES